MINESAQAATLQLPPLNPFKSNEIDVRFKWLCRSLRAFNQMGASSWIRSLEGQMLQWRLTFVWWQRWQTVRHLDLAAPFFYSRFEKNSCFWQLWPACSILMSSNSQFRQQYCTQFLVRIEKDNEDEGQMLNETGQHVEKVKRRKSNTWFGKWLVWLGLALWTLIFFFRLSISDIRVVFIQANNEHWPASKHPLQSSKSRFFTIFQYHLGRIESSNSIQATPIALIDIFFKREK